MKLSYKIINTAFQYPFTISKGTKTHQPALLVELEYFGYYGYGEAPAINYYDITVEKMVSDLEFKKRFVEQFALTDPERYWHYLHHLFPKNPFLVSALDMAGWDIFGKMKRKPLHMLWGNAGKEFPLTDYTIGISSEEEMKKKIVEKPWPVYKIKAGDEGDIERIAALRKLTDSPFRIDANAGWTLEQALQKIPLLKELGAEFIEQPLAKDNWEGMEQLKTNAVLPLFADESCVSEADVDKCAQYFDGINIKLTKCSGITLARRMIKNAKAKGLKVMLGCMNETSIGSAALLQLSPDADYLDADGPLLLKEDAATGLEYNNGIITSISGNGLG